MLKEINVFHIAEVPRWVGGDNRYVSGGRLRRRVILKASKIQCTLLIEKALLHHNLKLEIKITGQAAVYTHACLFTS